MERTDFSEHRVLVVGAKGHAIQLLRSLLGAAGVRNITHVGACGRALELLSTEHFSAVFCDYGLDEAGEKPFIVAARRSDAMLNPMIPIFVLQERARRRDVEKARDTGVTDVLTIPISAKALITKLQAAIQAPRPFIASTEFFGPDRRAKARPSNFGADRRKLAPKKIKVDFALRGIKPLLEE
jgi:two-component system, chemotaxis family, chemotaxis protein CheY